MKTKLESIIDCRNRLNEIQRHLDNLLDQVIEHDTIGFVELFGVCNDINLHMGYICDFIKNEHIVLDPIQRSAEQKMLDIELPKQQIRINANTD